MTGVNWFWWRSSSAMSTVDLWRAKAAAHCEFFGCRRVVRRPGRRPEVTARRAPVRLLSFYREGTDVSYGLSTWPPAEL